MKPNGNPVDEVTGTETTGHSWDGIEELNNPLPRWWLYLFYATIVWALVYWVLYPSWPLLTRGTAGLLGWSSRADVQAEITRVSATRAELDDQLAGLVVTYLEFKQKFRNNSDDVATAGRNGIGDRTHETDASAAIH